MDTLNKELLLALFDLSQLDASASVQRLADDLGRSRRAIADALDDLARAGFVRAETVRLTFLGLAIATKLRSRRRVSIAA
jgi:Mn-dependent DtxR family transcriptional regulator